MLFPRALCAFGAVLLPYVYHCLDVCIVISIYFVLIAPLLIYVHHCLDVFVAHVWQVHAQDTVGYMIPFRVERLIVSRKASRQTPQREQAPVNFSPLVSLYQVSQGSLMLRTITNVYQLTSPPH